MASRSGRGRTGARKPGRIPWLVLLLLAGSSYVFWVLPKQLPDQQIDVVFEPSGQTHQVSRPVKSESVAPASRTPGP